jgi:class 3 adenylate cyclase/CHASE2 domain-containing sensor protein
VKQRRRTAAARQRRHQRAHLVYRVVLGLVLVLPALVAQPYLPLVPASVWEDLTEPVYAALSPFAAPAPGQSPVVVVEVDKKSTEALGWPLQRRQVTHLLDRLRTSADRPWILSLLHIDDLKQRDETEARRAEREAENDGLAKAMRDYGRVIGSGLAIRKNSELDADQEDALLPRVLLSRTNETLEDIPRLPLELHEAQMFVEGQAAFGFGPYYSTNPVVRCLRMYLCDTEMTGSFVLPSALVWTAALAEGRGIATDAGGAGWPRRGETPMTPVSGARRFAFMHCDAAPGVATVDYYKRRGLRVVSLVDVLDDPEVAKTLRGRVLVLGSSEDRMITGPGPFFDGDSGVTNEHRLAARLLDELLADASLPREPMAKTPLVAAAPLVVAALLGVGAILLTPGWLALAASAFLGGLLVVIGALLAGGVYFVPVHALAALVGSIGGLVLLSAGAHYYAMRRQVAYSTKLNDALSGCNTLAEIEVETRAATLKEFTTVTLAFEGYDSRLFAALADPDEALSLLASPRSVEGQAVGEHRVESRLLLAAGGHGGRAVGLKTFEATFAIEGKGARLGKIRMALAYRAWERPFVTGVVDVLRVELGQHWHRVRILAERKLADYRYLLEHARGDILTRFLTKVLVGKFSDTRTMEENLRLVLTPRTTRAALLQADVRGYSKVAAKMAPMAMVRLLQGYFRRVVDAAQMVAQVKLIGDCIFLFIEEEAGTDDVSTADLALELGALLVRETLAQNRERAAAGQDVLNFGIAVHFGEVVVGNLSSDECIDYTVIGPNVNLVARLEELTKNPIVQERIGLNGLLLTEAAFHALKRYRGLAPQTLDLTALGASVRSFQDVAQVRGLTATEVAGLAHEGGAQLKLAG